MVKISELPSGAVISDGDLLPLVDSGTTKQATVGALRKHVLPDVGGAFDVREWGTLGAGNDTAILQQCIDDVAGDGNPAHIGLLGATILIPRTIVLTDTITVVRQSTRFLGNGGFTNEYHRYYPTYNGDRENGTVIRWEGAAGIPMFHYYDCKEIYWGAVRFEGEDTAPPSAAHHFFADASAQIGANLGKTFEDCHFGDWPWAHDGLNQGKIGTAILVNGSNGNNDRLRLNRCLIKGTDFGLDLPNSQTVWGSIKDTEFDGCGTAIRSAAQIQGYNLQIQSCDRGLDLIGTSADIYQLNSENTRELARMRGQSRLYVKGGYSQLVDVNPAAGSYPSLNGYLIDARDADTPYMDIEFDGHAFTNPGGVATGNLAKISVRPTNNGAGNFWPPRVAIYGWGTDNFNIIDTTLAGVQDQRIIEGQHADGRRTRHWLNRNRSNASEAIDFDTLETTSIILRDTVTFARYKVTMTSGTLTATAMS